MATLKILIHDEVEEESDCYHDHAPVDNFDDYNDSGNDYDEDGEDDGAREDDSALGDDGVFTPLPRALVLPSLPPPS